MTEPLQEFGWKKSSYERPSDKWVCGRLCDGTPCEFGPSASGRCRQTPECRPRRSLLQRRRIAVMSISALCLAACLLMWSGESSETLSPGPLASVHAPLNQRCVDCHTAASDDWTTSVFHSETALQDSVLCLNCHANFGQDALHAHGLPPEFTRVLSAEIKPETGSSRSLLLTASSAITHQKTHQEMACGRCHQEHHGRLHDLTQFSNNQCQTCHAQQFHSFEQGHPEFVDTTKLRTTRIHFDHTSHFNRYFLEDAKRLMPDASPPQNCTACHHIGHGGAVMETRGFEQMCSACHNRGIQDQDFPGIPFFALPSSGGEDVGEWPSTATMSSVKKRPGFQRMLFDVEPDLEDSRNVATAQLALEIKEFLFGVSRRGQAAIEDRLGADQKVFGKFEPSIVPALLHAQQLWFPNLQQEMQARLSGERIEKPAVVPKSTPLFPPESEISGGWSVRNSDHTIRYRPLGHADPVVKQWLEKSVERWNLEPVLSGKDPVVQMLETLANPTASGSAHTSGPVSSGRCFACHGTTYDRTTRKWMINWKSQPRSSARHRLTHFSHRPHILDSSNAGCAECHQLNSRANPNPLASFELASLFQVDSQSKSLHSSGLLSITKSSCTNCHNDASGLQNCTQCHKYHVLEFHD